MIGVLRLRSSGFVTTTTYGYYLFSRSLLAAGLNGALDEAEMSVE